MLDYIPLDMELLEATLSRKRIEYLDMVQHYFGGSSEELDYDKSEMSTFEKANMKQIIKDVKRTCPEVSLFTHKILYNMLVRILYIFTIRHPATGYVQGINDLSVPFILVFLSEHIENPGNPDNIYDISESELEFLSREKLSFVEADSYWCLAKMIDGI